MASHRCELLRGLLVAYFLLASQVHSVNVAPNDGDELCLAHPLRESVPDTNKVVLDTQDYRETTLVTNSGDNMIWNSENFDNITDSTAIQQWIDQAQTTICYHELIACNPLQAGQNNWLVTQYINITDDGVDELVINMEFTTSDNNMVCMSCQQSFSVSSYETNVIDEVGRRNQSFYTDTGATFFHTQNDEEQETAQNRISLSSKGLYLSVIDTGSCTRIIRIYVFYYVCPQQVVNMVEYPVTVSPPSTNPQDRSATGTCIENASPVLGSNLELECNVNGNWEDSELSCSCNPGYKIIADLCESCDEGKYKSTQGNEECTECPANSNSTSPGAVSCECINGYYRTNNENVIVNCTAPPTAPLNLESTTTDSIFVTVSWSAPVNNGGRNDSSHRVTYTNGSFTGPVFSVTDALEYTITGLTPSTQYTISVTAVNGVSDQDSDTAGRTTSITVTTANRGPSSPTGVVLPDDSTILQWIQPDSLYGTLLRYNILIADSDNASLATVIANTTNTSYNLNTLDITQGTYYIWVQGVTGSGVGELSQSVTFTTNDQANGSQVTVDLTVVITVTVVSVLLFGSVLAGLVMFACYKNKSKEPQGIKGDNNGRQSDERVCQVNVAYGVVQPSSPPPVDHVYEYVDELDKSEYI